MVTEDGNRSLELTLVFACNNKRIVMDCDRHNCDSYFEKLADFVVRERVDFTTESQRNGRRCAWMCSGKRPTHSVLGVSNTRWLTATPRSIAPCGNVVLASLLNLKSIWVEGSRGWFLNSLPLWRVVHMLHLKVRSFVHSSLFLVPHVLLQRGF